MSAKATLDCRPNSYPFEKRVILLDLPVTIGRSLCNGEQPTPTNVIFDCKVLSKNHACIWYRNGLVYLTDTKSGGGTFVNDERLSESRTQSFPRIVASGDIVQFGGNEPKSTHKGIVDCIVANVTLQFPYYNGTQLHFPTRVLNSVVTVPVKDLYKLNNYILNALQREQMLNCKLQSLRRLLRMMKQAVDFGWNGITSEDMHLSGVDRMDGQLQTFTKNFAEHNILSEQLQCPQGEKDVNQAIFNQYIPLDFQETESIPTCKELKRALLCAKQKFKISIEMMEQESAQIKNYIKMHNFQMPLYSDIENKFLYDIEDYTDTRSKLDNEIMNFHIHNNVKGHEEYNSKSVCPHLKSSSHLNDNFTSSRGHINDVTNSIQNHNEKELMNNSLESVIHRLNSLLEIYNNLKKQIDLTQRQIILLEDKKMYRIQIINSLEDDLKLFNNKLFVHKEDNQILKNSLNSLLQWYKQNNLNDLDSTLTNSSSLKGIDKMPNRFESANYKSMQTEMDKLKDEIIESDKELVVMKQTANFLQADLFQNKIRLREIAKNHLEQGEKLRNVIAVKEDIDRTISGFSELLKILDNSIMQAKQQGKIELELQHFEMSTENKDTILRQQLHKVQINNDQNKQKAQFAKDKSNLA